MRIADIQLSFPAILIALSDRRRGARPLAPPPARRDRDLRLIFSIGISGWVQYARTVRGSTLVEKNKEYVQAARVIGIHPALIMLRHVLPNVTGPVLVIATIQPGDRDHHRGDPVVPRRRRAADQPVARHPDPGRQRLLFSGEWWITIFPGIALGAALVLAVNLLGDWLRDALNPKLR